jgi:hypothetical protein
MELAAELSGKTPGSKIRIGYMYKSDWGYLPKETSLVLGKSH